MWRRGVPRLPLGRRRRHGGRLMFQCPPGGGQLPAPPGRETCSLLRPAAASLGGCFGSELCQVSSSWCPPVPGPQPPCPGPAASPQHQLRGLGVGSLAWEVWSSAWGGLLRARLRFYCGCETRVTWCLSLSPSVCAQCSRVKCILCAGLSSAGPKTRLASRSSRCPPPQPTPATSAGLHEFAWPRRLGRWGEAVSAVSEASLVLHGIAPCQDAWGSCRSRRCPATVSGL